MDGELDFDDDELIDDVPQEQEPAQPIDDDLPKDVLSLQGITDLNKIKFEDETGSIIERSWDSLSREEQLNILTNQQETQPEDEYGLSDEEIELLNNIRSSGKSIEEYMQELYQPVVEKSYKIDELSDEDVYALNLLDKIGQDNITDEEITEAIENAKRNEIVFKKTVEGLRKEYQKLQEDEEAQLLNAQEAQQQADYEKFATSIMNEIQSLNSFAGQDLELSKEDTEKLGNFMLNLDNNGMSELGKSLQNPTTLTEIAFWIANKNEIIEELTKQMQDNYKRGYEAGLSDKQTSSKLVFTPKKKETKDEFDNFVEDDDWN